VVRRAPALMRKCCWSDVVVRSVVWLCMRARLCENGRERSQGVSVIVGALRCHTRCGCRWRLEPWRVIDPLYNMGCDVGACLASSRQRQQFAHLRPRVLAAHGLQRGRQMWLQPAVRAAAGLLANRRLRRWLWSSGLSPWRRQLPLWSGEETVPSARRRVRCAALCWSWVEAV
jgi:hypothetical protein